MFERELQVADLSTAIESGEVIREYPDERPYPSALLLAFIGAVPVHVVVARDTNDGTCYVVTAYVPDPALWTPDFRNRRPS